MATHEHTINFALGEVLQALRPHSWRVHAEQTRTLCNSNQRPDILLEEASQWPVVIEAERTSHSSAESDARERLGQIVQETCKPIESAIALVYPQSVLNLQGQALRDAIERSDELQYALYTQTLAGGEERLPESGWLRGSVKDVAVLAHRASTPAPRVERLGRILEDGVYAAAGSFTQMYPSHSSNSPGAQLARILAQADDQAGQTRRMAMTVLANGLMFHAALAATQFEINDGDNWRTVRPLSEFRFDREICYIPDLYDEWRAILRVNYWPIFATALELLRVIPLGAQARVLEVLWDAVHLLFQAGVTRSHDLTGAIFQRLISDRKFLATYYTRPGAAALLAGMAIDSNRPTAETEWSDSEALSTFRVGDFACGTGTLLSAAYQHISLLYELHGGDPRTLHATMMETGLVGLDVLNIAVHLTATMLAGAHPDVPFAGDSLLTMPHGPQSEESNGSEVVTGSLELLPEGINATLIQRAAAVAAGGRRREDVEDIVARVGHRSFDIVIMNPPFTSPTNPEVQDETVLIPAFAAFEATTDQQKLMSNRCAFLTRQANGAGHGNAGIASNFIDLADVKLRAGGTVALVLPLSAVSGQAWRAIRDRWITDYTDLTVITIAQSGSETRAFSDDTNIAECLVIARREASPSSQPLGAFVVLKERPRDAVSGSLLASAIQQTCRQLREQPNQVTAGATATIQLGDTVYGQAVLAPLELGKPWPFVGVSDLEVAAVAYRLAQGALAQFDQPQGADIPIPITELKNIANRGPVDRDVKADTRGGTDRGPFLVHKPPRSAVPTYPILWGHHAPSERRLIVAPDAEGEVRNVPDERQLRVNQAAEEIRATASRVHINRDLRFNSQSLVVATTQRKSIGGQAWPTLLFTNPQHEYAFALWSNSTLGLLMYWWIANKRQNGRGNVSVTKIPILPTLDTRALTEAQHAEAKKQFQALSNERFLPFDQIDEDPARAKLDRAILVEVLGLPESLVAKGGPIDLIRRKLAQEPQIHGGKKSRVLFTPTGERSVKREDR